MRQLLLGFALFLSLPAWATWTLTQTKQNGACPAGTNQTTCAITVTSTGAGHLIVVFVGGVFSSNGTTMSISSISGGGTYTHCASCLINSGPCTVTCAADAFYTLSSTSGTTTITVTMSAKVGSGAIWQAWMIEASFTGSSIALNDGGTNSHTASSISTIAGVVPGTSTAGLLRCITTFYDSSTNNPVTSVDSGYTNQFSGACATTPCYGFGTLINTSSSAQPTWTLTNLATIHDIVQQIAFSENTSTGGCTNSISMMGAGCK